MNKPMSSGEVMFWLIAASTFIGGAAYGLLCLRNLLFPRKAQHVDNPQMTQGNDAARRVSDMALSSGDTRTATIAGVDAIPARVPLTQGRHGAIPLLFTGTQWHNVSLGVDGPGTIRPRGRPRPGPRCRPRC